jgi:hypothetical protein
VLQEGQSPAEGHAIARDLMQQLGIQEADLIAAAFADMLMERVVGASAASDPPPTRSSTPPAAGQSTEITGGTVPGLRESPGQSGPHPGLSRLEYHEKPLGIRTAAGSGEVAKSL